MCVRYLARRRNEIEIIGVHSNYQLPVQPAEAEDGNRRLKNGNQKNGRAQKNEDPQIFETRNTLICIWGWHTQITPHHESREGLPILFYIPYILYTLE